jgi:hypothetical protein
MAEDLKFQQAMPGIAVMSAVIMKHRYWSLRATHIGGPPPCPVAAPAVPLPLALPQAEPGKIIGSVHSTH